MGDKDYEVKSVLKRVDSVTPGSKDHAQLTVYAAKEAGVKFLSVVSVLTAILTDMIPEILLNFGAMGGRRSREIGCA